MALDSAISLRARGAHPLRRRLAVVTAAAIAAGLTSTVASAAPAQAADTANLQGTATAFRLSNGSDVNNVKLSWARVAGASSYEISRSTGGAGSFEDLGAVAGNTFDDYDLPVGTSYAYQVQALDSSNAVIAQSDALTGQTFTEGNGYRTFDNTDLAASLDLSSSIKVGGTYYRYDYSAPNGAAQIVEKTSTDGHTFTGDRVVLTAADICGSAVPALSTCKLESVHPVMNTATGKVVIVAHFENQADYNLAQLLIAQGTPGDDFDVTYNARPLGNDSRDSTVFVDGSAAYVISATNTNADLNLYKLSSNWSQPESLTKKLFAGQNREAPSMVKVNGTYYLFTSQAAGWYPSQAKYATATSLDGTWSDLKDIGNTTTFGTQSGGVVKIGDQYAMVGYRWGAQWKYPESQNSARVLPLSFDGDYASYDLYQQVDYREDGSGAGAGSAIVPVQAGENLSLGKPVRAAAATSPNQASTANDGIDDDVDNYYMPTADAVPFSWEVDLKQAAKISRVNLTTKLVKGSETYYKYTIEGSLDRKNYTMLYDGTGNQIIGFRSDAITDNNPYRYLRVTVSGITNIQNSNSATWARGINEVTVLGTPAGTSAPDTVETPTASVAAGTYYATQSVTLATATDGATVRYTTDGTVPTATHGTVYTDPIDIASTTTLKAVAVKDGLVDSSQITSKYVIKDGATPVSLANPIYAGAAAGEAPSLPETVDVKTADGQTRSASVTWDLDGYTFDNPYRSYTVYGTVDGGLVVSASVETAPTSVKYFIDSGMAGQTSPSYEGVKSIPGVTLLNGAPDQNSNNGARWGFNSNNGGYGGTRTSSTPYDKDSNGIYGINNSGNWLRYDLPNLPAGTYTLTAGFQEWWSGPRTMNVIVENSSASRTTIASNVAVGTGSGYSKSKIASGTFTQTADGAVTFYLQRSAGTEAPAVAWLAVAAGNVTVDTTPVSVSAPTADVASGTYKTAQTVTLATATDGASIYYTTDGTDPSRTNGTRYSGPVTVDKAETLKAVAFKNGVLSSILERAFQIDPVPADGYTSVPVGKTWYDTSGNSIQAHGGGFLQKDGWYYWVGENKSNNSAEFDGVSLYRSRDLVNWEYMHDILTTSTPGMCNSGSYSATTCKLERPKLLFNASSGKYVLWGHWETEDSYAASHLIVATSDTIDGDYTIVRNFRPGAGQVTTEDADPTYEGGDSNWGYGSRDFTVFKDPDSDDAYLVSTQDGSRMRVYKLTDDYTNVDWQDSYLLFDGGRREAPALVKAGDYYFVFTSSQSGWYPNQAMYSYTKDPSDPNGWSPLTPVGNNTTYFSQPTNVMTVDAVDGSRSYVYMGDRWNPNQLANSTYVWLPLDFADLAGDDPSVAMNYDPSWSLDIDSGHITHNSDTLVSQDKPILSATSAASSTYPAGAANDGNVFNLNTSGDNTNYYQPTTVPFSWAVDLQRPYDLRRIDLSFRSYNGSETYSGYTVQGSNDGDDWTTLVADSANKTVGFKSNSLTGTYQYVRVNVSKVVNDHNGSEADWAAGLVEVQIYADTNAPTLTVTTPDAPDSGWFNTDVAATLASTDTDLDTIEYRVGPSDDWHTYGAPVTFGEGISVLQARAIDKSGNVSDIVERTVKVDKTAPDASISLPAANSAGWYTARPSATVTGSDGGAGVNLVEYRVGTTGTWSTYASPVQLGEGSSTIQARVTDAAGNVSQIAQQTANVDTTKPTVTGKVDSSRTLTVTGSDTHLQSVEYAIGQGTWQSYTGPVKLNDDPQVVRFRATDQAGNISDIGMVEVDVHMTTTATSLTAPDSVAVGSPVTLTASVQPTSVAGTVEFFDGSTSLGIVAVSGGTATLTVPAPGAGQHSYSARFVPADADKVSPSESAVQTVTVAKATPKVAVKVPRTSYGETATVTVKVRGDGPAASGSALVSVDGVSKMADVEDGVATLKLPDSLDAGVYRVRVAYQGDDAHEAATGTAKLTVMRARSTTEARLVGSKVQVTVRVPDTDVTPTGDVVVKAKGKVVKSATLRRANDGKITLQVPNSVRRGTSVIKVQFMGTADVRASSVNVSTHQR